MFDITFTYGHGIYQANSINTPTDGVLRTFLYSPGYLSQLDHRAKLVSAAAYTSSTLATRRSQWRAYLRFCASFGLVPIPASPRTVIRFLIHLSTYCKYSTIINYLSAINVLHRHFGHNVTFQDVFAVKLIKNYPLLRRYFCASVLSLWLRGTPASGRRC